MIWVAFATGIILGLFAGMLLLGLARESAISRRQPDIERPPSAGPPVLYAAPESRIGPRNLQTGRLLTYANQGAGSSCRQPLKICR